MEYMQLVLDPISIGLSIFSVIVLVWGVLVAMKDFLLSLPRSGHPLAMRQLTNIKNNLGGYVLLSLEILIAADIVISIARPTMEDILKLAALVAIRTVISFFLNKEIKESEHDNPMKDNGS